MNTKLMTSLAYQYISKQSNLFGNNCYWTSNKEGVSKGITKM